MKVNYMFIIGSLRSTKDSSITFLSKGQTKLKSILKLIFLSYEATHIYKADKVQT